jgi:pimeloyl-ACP methyl ester carboxylesterase
MTIALLVGIAGRPATPGGRVRASWRTRTPIVLAAAVAAALPVVNGAASATPSAAPSPAPQVQGRPAQALTDEALVRSLPGGFQNRYARVNGVRLHYVVGGRGTPLVLLPGWPQTWWEFHKVMPALARRHRVIAVDLRGMGGSDKPAGGYDKKTMARDVYELVRRLGYDKVDVAGHDIGAMVAYSFAANHPNATRRIALLDVPHPDESWNRLTLLPPSGWRTPPPYYLWWFAFNQVRGLPEQLLAGRSRFLVDWMMGYALKNPKAVGDRDRAVYARAYSYPDAIRAGNGWYQAFGQDIVDQRAYGKVTAPIMALASEDTYPGLRALLPTKGTDVQVVRVANTGHYIPEEQPDAVVRSLTRFFGNRPPATGAAGGRGRLGSGTRHPARAAIPG